MSRARKSHKKVTHHRRHKRGSMHGVQTMAMKGVSVIAGGVAAQVLSNVIATQFATSTMKNYLQAGAPIVAGFLLPKFVKSDIGAGIGAGMIAVGGVKLLQSFGVISGVPAISGNRRVGLAPTGSNPRGVISGLTTRTAALMTA